MRRCGSPTARRATRPRPPINYLHHVDADGLDPADYPVPDFATLKDPAELAEADLKLSMAVITYAHHASVGRVHWSRVSADIFYDQKPPEPADVLAKMVEAKDTAAALNSYEPQIPQYIALKAKLAEYRAGNTENGKPRIASRTGPEGRRRRTTASRSCATGSAFPATAARLMTRRWPRR